MSIIRRPRVLPAFVLGIVAVLMMAPSLAIAQTNSDGNQDAKKVDPKTQPKTIIEVKGKPDVVIAGSVDHISLIDAQLEKKWKDNKLEPAKRCTDFEFIRRASLDLIGRIARPAEISEFLKWPAEKRRGMLIEKLLNSTEFADNFANVLTNLLMTRTSTKLHREQMQSWLSEEFAKEDADWSKLATSLISATGKTNGDGDAPAVNFILTHLGERVPGAARGQRPVGHGARDIPDHASVSRTCAPNALSATTTRSTTSGVRNISGASTPISAKWKRRWVVRTCSRTRRGLRTDSSSCATTPASIRRAWSPTNAAAVWLNTPSHSSSMGRSSRQAYRPRDARSWPRR